MLAAGEGRRLRPLTASTPKALCPVGNVALLDRAIARVATLGFAGPARLAVNACYLGEQVVAHIGDRAHLSVEPGEPLGTAGGLGNLKPWIDGRGVLAVNADAYLDGAEVTGLLDGWDGSTVRLLGVMGPPHEFGEYRFAGLSLLPADLVEGLEAVPSDLVRTTWRPAEHAGRLEVVPFGGTYLDTGTARDYLAANLHAAGAGSLIDPTATVTGPVTHSVIGAGARIEGAVTRAVVWPGGVVAAGEHLVDAIRVGADLTVTLTATMSPVITAIVLVDCATDSIPEVAETIANLKGVSEVYSVAGNVDLIAVVRVREFDDIADVIAGHISKVPGVVDTDTHIAFRAYSQHDLEEAFSIGLPEAD